MRKKILAAVLAATMPEIMNVRKKNVATKKTIEVETEKVIDELDDNVVVEENKEEVAMEMKRIFAYDFEGKYWLRYSEYGHKGMYFDGRQAISKIEDGGTYCKEYSVEDDVICIGEPFYRYEVKDGKLGLAYVRDERCVYSYYDEVKKEEYDSIFK